MLVKAHGTPRTKLELTYRPSTMQADFIWLAAGSEITEMTIWKISELLVSLKDDYMVRLHPGIHEDIVDSFAEEYQGIRNHLLGSVFVICQERISTVVSRALKVRRYKCANHEDVSKIPDGKAHFLECGRQLPNSIITKILVVDAIANFYKHKSEWPLKWLDLKKRNSRKDFRTALLVRFSGISEYNNSIENCLPRFGITADLELIEIQQIVDEWAVDVARMFE